MAKYDEVGYWSEIKLDIVRKYASAYSTVLANQKFIQRYIYIDAFAGSGVHISKATGKFVLGSPLNALNVWPSFHEFHFVDLDRDKAEQLRELTAEKENVFVYNDDCNRVLLEDVFPRVKHEDYHRALCLLDPYGLHLDWKVMQTAGQMRTIEIFLNFMVMDMNMNVLKRDPNQADSRQVERMNRFWGDESWRQVAYTTERNLFGYAEKTANEDLAQAFRKRLKTEAGFSYVPDPIPMRNSKGATIYYLFFASPKKTGEKIVKEIFAKYSDREK